MHVSEVARALEHLKFDPGLVGSMDRLGESIERVRAAIVRCPKCGGVDWEPEESELQSLAAEVVDFAGRLQARRHVAGKEIAHEARR